MNSKLWCSPAIFIAAPERFTPRFRGLRCSVAPHSRSARGLVGTACNNVQHQLAHMSRRECPFALAVGLADAGGINPTTVVLQVGLIAAATTIVLHVGCIGRRSHGSAKRQAP